ncbi:hypothetical protein [Deinococcus aerolatus]|uniref:hypothetical protein n=1 Tax=Deinococcus aerolatus TaxID=522487 RepID=UPI0016649C32|nr:hypothetical protein [Deinococcus aerolatus]
MKHVVRLLLLWLLLTVGTAQAAAVGGAQAAAQAGHTASLHVTFGLRDLLVSRDAPNTVHLSTPWGQASAEVSGAAHPDATFSGYYRSVRPLHLRVRVPAGTRPGQYPATLHARLFTCDQKRGLCIRRDANVAVSIQVVAAGVTAEVRPTHLTDATLAPLGRFR